MGKNGPEPSVGFLWVGMGEAWQGSECRVAGVDNFGRLWTLWLVPSCPVPGPGVTQGRGQCESSIREVGDGVGSRLTPPLPRTTKPQDFKASANTENKKRD